MRYNKEVRAGIAAANPTLKVNEVAKIVGKQWNSLTDSAKKPYIDAFAKENVEYRKKYDAYKAEKQLHEKPKKSPSSYILFSRDENGDLEDQENTSNL